MKRALVISVLMSISTPVLSADLLPQPVADMPYSWTGLYIGGQAGGGWNRSRWNVIAIPTTVNFNVDESGAVLGGQVGYNLQHNQFVFGMEGDLAGAVVKGAAQCANFGQTCGAEQDYLASVRGRVGYAFDRLLVYGDGGLAFTNYKFTIGTTSQTESLGEDRIGWTAGLGTEYAFSNHWTGGFEWNYYDFGFKGGDGLIGALVKTRNTENVVVGRVNFKF